MASRRWLGRAAIRARSDDAGRHDLAAGRWPRLAARGRLARHPPAAHGPQRLGRLGLGFSLPLAGGRRFSPTPTARATSCSSGHACTPPTPRISRAGRAVILADAGNGRLRLWQIVRSEATLARAPGQRVSAARSEPSRRRTGRRGHSTRSGARVVRGYDDRPTLHALDGRLRRILSTDVRRADAEQRQPAARASLAAASCSCASSRRSCANCAALASTTPRSSRASSSRAEFAAREAPARWLSEIVQTT